MDGYMSDLPSLDSLVTFRISRSLKNSWVRQSQQAGAKLTDWIVAMVDLGCSYRSESSTPIQQVQALQPGLSVSQLRHLAGLTQEGLAASVSVSKSTVEKWESGVTTPSAATVELLQLLAGQHPEYLLIARR